MQGTAFIFFAIFAVILVGIYLAVRRRWASPGVIAVVGVLASIIDMVLISLAQGNSVFQAAVVGIVVGAIFSGATLAVAWYFHTNEVRGRYSAKQDQPEMPSKTNS
jgi:uncharacterized membrane protein